VPRWGGDGNFFPIIAQTKAITQTLGEVREQVADAWPQETGSPQGTGASPETAAGEPHAE
jgi:ATP adenylyltransferase